MKAKRILLITLLSIITVISILGCKSDDDAGSITVSTTAAYQQLVDWIHQLWTTASYNDFQKKILKNK